MAITNTIRGKVCFRAKNQVGTAYAFGATGPSAYDCSGSTLAAWAPWLTLPHSASMQMHAAGVRLVRHTPWSRLALRGGDLCFYYPSIDGAGADHVAIYVKRDPRTLRRLIVNATDKAHGVELIGIDQYAKPFAYGLVGH